MQFIWPKDIFPIRIGPQSEAGLVQQTVQAVASLRSYDLTLFVRSRVRAVTPNLHRHIHLLRSRHFHLRLPRLRRARHRQSRLFHRHRNYLRSLLRSMGRNHCLSLLRAVPRCNLVCTRSPLQCRALHPVRIATEAWSARED